MVYLYKDGRNTESSQNSLEGTLKIIPSSNPQAMDRDASNNISLIKAPSNLVLNCTRGGGFTASLGSRLQCL